jgi:hypothetical protein
LSLPSRTSLSKSDRITPPPPPPRAWRLRQKRSREATPTHNPHQKQSTTHTLFSHTLPTHGVIGRPWAWTAPPLEAGPGSACIIAGRAAGRGALGGGVDPRHTLCDTPAQTHIHTHTDSLNHTGSTPELCGEREGWLVIAPARVIASRCLVRGCYPPNRHDRGGGYGTHTRSYATCTCW